MSAGRKKETGGLNRTLVSVRSGRLFCGLDRKCAWSGDYLWLKVNGLYLLKGNTI